MVIVGIDPGVTTGWVVADYTEGMPSIIEYGQETFEGYLEACEFITCRLLPKADVIVLERFDLRPHNKFIADLSPVEINSVIQFWNSFYKTKPALVYLTTPAQHKALVTNEVLKRLGWYIMPRQVQQKDANDVRDAFRLLTHHLVEREHDREFTLVGWPR